MKGLSDNDRFIANTAAGGSVIHIPPEEALELFARLALQHQWSYKDDVRASGGGRYEVDKYTALEAKLNALQSQLNKQAATAKAVETPSYELCGDEGHVYADCPQRAAEKEVNSLNSMPSYFPKPPFSQSYSNAPSDRQYWKENPDRPHFGQSSNNPSRYQNHGPNQGSNNRPPFTSGQVQLNQEFKSFMHEQGKVNMIILEELQKIREAQTKGSNSEAPKLPTKPEPNPSGDCKSVCVLRSGKSYAAPANPEAVPTKSVPANTAAVPEAETALCDPLGAAQKADRSVCDQQESPATQQEAPATPQVIPAPPQERPAPQQTAAQTEKSTPKVQQSYRPPVPFPQRLAKHRSEEQYSKFMEVLKQLSITIPFTDALA